MPKSFTFDARASTCILCIFVYGFYGITTPSLTDLADSYLSWFYLLFPIITLTVYLLINKGEDSQRMHLCIPFFNTKVLLNSIFAFIIAVAVINYVTLSLSGDELFYANYGFIHSIKILPFLVSATPNILDLDVSIVIRAISLVLLIALCFLSYLLFRIGLRSYLSLSLATLIILISARIIFLYIGGNPIIHSPLTSAYAALVGILIGISDLALQSGQFLIYVLFSFFVFTRFRMITNNTFQASILALAVLSIPATFFLGSDLEPSLWTMICYSIILLYLSEEKFKQYKSLVYVVLLFSLFRLPSIFALVPIMIHLIAYDDHSRKFRLRVSQYLNIFSPAIIFLPFFVFAMIEGSAATTESTFSISRLFQITLDGTMWKAYADVFSPVWLLSYLILVLLSFRSRLTQINIVFLFVLSIVYFSIDEDLWSLSKYRVEVFTPLLLAQLYILIKQINFKNFSKLISSIAAAMILLNFYSLLSFPMPCSKEEGVLQNHNLMYKIDYGCNFLNQPPYDYSHAMTYLDDYRAINSTYIPGVHYGVFMHAMNGASVEGYLRAEKIWNEQIELNNQLMSEFSANPDMIHADLRIDYVLLGFTKDISFIKSGLISHNWTEIALSKNGRSLPVFLLKRPN